MHALFTRRCWIEGLIREPGTTAQIDDSHFAEHIVDLDTGQPAEPPADDVANWLRQLATVTGFQMAGTGGLLRAFPPTPSARMVATIAPSVPVTASPVAPAVVAPELLARVEERLASVWADACRTIGVVQAGEALARVVKGAG